MSSCVLDASAVIALLRSEPGEEHVVIALLAGAVISSVNSCEVVGKLADAGMQGAAIARSLSLTGLTVVVFDEVLAHAAGLLRTATRHLGLSLGDCACLALAQQANLPVLTTDRQWQSLQIGVQIRLIR